MSFLFAGVRIWPASVESGQRERSCASLRNIVGNQGVESRMEVAAALDFVRSRRHGVLVTAKGDGRPQLSNIFFHVGDDGAISISVTDSRAKTANMRRDPRVSLHVASDDFWQYVVIEGDASLTPVATDPHDATVEALVEHYRTAAGEHPDWDDYRRAMVADRRLLVRITPTRAYGILSSG